MFTMQENGRASDQIAKKWHYLFPLLQKDLMTFVCLEK